MRSWSGGTCSAYRLAYKGAFLACTHRLRAHPVGVVATLEPLHGLRGMVLGMNSEALTTTALGIGQAGRLPLHQFQNG